MTNWQMLQHWQAEYTRNKEKEAAALKLAYDKEPSKTLSMLLDFEGYAETKEDEFADLDS